MGRFEVGDGEAVVMFRMGEQVVAARGRFSHVDVERRYQPYPVEFDAARQRVRWNPWNPSVIDITLAMQGAQVVVVRDGEPQWDEPAPVLPAPRLPG